MGFSGWGKPLPRALLSQVTGPRGRARLSLLAACALLFPLHRWTLTCLTSTPARGCWSGFTPTFSTRLGSIPVLPGGVSLFSWPPISVLPGEPSLLSHLPLGKRLLTQCSSPARDPRSQPCAASGLIAEGTRRWGLGESCHEPKMVGGLWKVVGDAGAGSRPFCCRQ